ncbi:hypothetical protein EPD60_13880 [Flaviaesturariibacter flavus]|uniref:Beta-lactamase-inhibitor-like PepSY-like domain-containing protein n=1 Tax=Flaviaesturariibacter flavus TaxID=2502780 RepID=A0A4R1B4V8_9BACT|nr:hypothetical protein [Flaviaesturariibacter flavus]TCJ13152.1 hypothetical protein EPD60_13880 [Flaviaesturariibacter flavus]
MKTILFALSIFAASICNSARAAETIENPQALAAFTAQFGKATGAQWTETGAFYQVRFTLDGVVSNAWYDAEGSLVALTRKQSVESLPASLRAALDLKQRWVSDLTELETESGITWFITLEDADHKVVLESSAGARRWVRFDQSSKL